MENILSFFLHENMLYSLIVILSAFIIDFLFHRFVINRIDEKSKRYRWKKVLKYFLIFLTLLIIISLWLEEFDLATFLGLSGAGIAIALRDLLTNIIGWFYILTKSPFSIGDRIEINNSIGDVIDISLFHFSVLEVGNRVGAEQSTGRIMHIPNSSVFDYNLANFNSEFPFIWNEIPVMFTFESDFNKAREILIKIAKEVAGDTVKKGRNYLNTSSPSKYMVYYGKLTPIVYTNAKDSGFLLTLRYLCEVRQKRSTEDEIWNKILKEVNDSKDVEFAYKTQRIYFKDKESEN
ncbi:MAG: mechanosensitive ion channel family protein [Candidatus Woesearchaeota archaeon]